MLLSNQVPAGPGKRALLCQRILPACLGLAFLATGPMVAQAHGRYHHHHHHHHYHHWHSRHFARIHFLPGRRQVAPVPAAQRAPFEGDVVSAAQRNHVDPALLRAVITVESGYHRHVVSHAGAVGLMQLLPATARRYGAHNVYDPRQNIAAGARYLHHLLHQFDANVQLALAAYNAGEGAVIDHGYRIPPYRETIAYVPRVMSLYQHYRHEHGWG